MRLMTYVVHLILVMQLLFLVLAAEETKISSLLIKRVVEVYHNSDVKVDVHASVKKYVMESGGLSKMGRDQAFDTVDGLLKRYCESPDMIQLKDDILSARALAAAQPGDRRASSSTATTW